MTWQHVCCVGVAAMLVVAAIFVCGSRPECGPIVSNIVTLATIIISGTMGNAGVFRIKQQQDGRFLPVKNPTEGDYVSQVGPK